MKKIGLILIFLLSNILISCGNKNSVKNELNVDLFEVSDNLFLDEFNKSNIISGVFYGTEYESEIIWATIENKPKEKIYVIDSEEKYNGIFKEEYLNNNPIDFNSEIVILYSYSQQVYSDLSIYSSNLKNGIINIKFQEKRNRKYNEAFLHASNVIFRFEKIDFHKANISHFSVL